MIPCLFLYLIVFVFGLTVGSFLNCIIHRLYTKESFLTSRSHCPHCKHILGWQDLIPVFSFIILKGKCRYCQKKISWQYPLVEIAAGILFLIVLNSRLYVYSLANQGSASVSEQVLIFHLIFYLIITCFLIIIFVYDLKHYIIPDKIVYPAIGIVFIYNVLRDPTLLMRSGLVAILAAGFFLSIVLASRGKWMGLGDVKLAFFMGLVLGWPNILVALFLAFFIGAIIGVVLIAFRKKTLKSEVPFGPFLVIGTFIALFWAQNLINWYLNILTT